MYNVTLRMDSPAAQDNAEMEPRTSREPGLHPSDNADAEWRVQPLSHTAAPDWGRAAEQIAIEASRLQSVALANNQQFLAYLIEMVVLEAWRGASREPLSEEDREMPAHCVSP